MSSADPESPSIDILSSDDDHLELLAGIQKIYLLGYIPKAQHNSALKDITNDLLSNYYLSWNKASWSGENGRSSISRSLVTNSDVVLFFVNEQTLKDANCLLTLQFAWHSMLPIIMLRQPSMKLVISNRDSKRDREKVILLGDGSIVRSPEPWQLLNGVEEDSINYSLLQDILYEGYKVSTLYDSNDHAKSMTRIRRRLKNLFNNIPNSKDHSLNSNTSSQPHFYLSPSSRSTNSIFSKTRPEKPRSLSRRRMRPEFEENLNQLRLNLSQSTGNLHRIIKTPYPSGNNSQVSIDSQQNEAISPGIPLGEIQDETSSPNDLVSEKSIDNLNISDDEEEEEINADSLQLPPLTPLTPGSGFFNLTDRHSANTNRSRLNHSSSVTSRASSQSRRLSLSCLDDMSYYQQTKYLVFPLCNTDKKPYVVKFPDDLHTQDVREVKNVWGSETSIEEEIRLAVPIDPNVEMDLTDDSPIHSPVRNA